MRRKTRLARWIVAGVASGAYPASAQINASWTNLSAGTWSWTTPSNWSTNPLFPNNTQSQTFNVSIATSPDVTVLISPGPVIAVDQLSLIGATLEVQNSDGIYINHNVQLDGTLRLRPHIGSNGLFLLNNAHTVSGNGTIEFADSTFGSTTRIDTLSTVSIGAGITIRTGTGSGIIGNSTGAAVITNFGTVSAQTPGQSIRLGPYFGVNNGTLHVSDGTLILAHSFTPATLGTIDRTGGTIAMAGTLNLGNSTFDVANHGGGWIFCGNVQNGTLADSTGIKFSTVQLSNYAKLTNVTLANDAYALGIGLGVGSSLTLSQTTLTLDQSGMGIDGSSQNPGQLLGTGTIIVNPNNAAIRGDQSSLSPTWNIGSGITVRAGFLPGSQIEIAGFRNMGTIICDNPAATVKLDDAWTNQGTIRLTAGTLELDGNYRRADLGDLQRTAGSLIIGGEIDNTGTVFDTTALVPFSMKQTYMNGGTLTGAASLPVGASQVTLDSVHIDCDITTQGGVLSLLNGCVLDNQTLDVRGTLSIDTLNGSGTVLLSSLTVPPLARWEPRGLGTLDINSKITVIAGANSRIGVTSGPCTVTNYGAVIVDQPNGALRIEGGQLRNEGTILISNDGSIRFGSDSSTPQNNGLISVDHALLELNGMYSHTLVDTVQLNQASMTLFGNIDNNGQTLDLRVGASWKLSASVNGGTIAVADGVAATAKNATLYATAIRGDLGIESTVSIYNTLLLDNAHLRLNNGSINFQYPGFTIPVAILGSGSITFETGQSNSIRTDAGTLTIGPGIHISTAGTRGGVSATDMRLVNQGVMEVVNPGKRLILTARDLQNDNLISAAPGTTLYLSVQRSLINSGTVDLNSTLIFNYIASNSNPFASVVDQIRSGYNDGSWDGPLINSSTAATDPQRATGIGCIEGGNLQSVYNGNYFGESIDVSTIVARLTWYGDTDLNGEINFDDYVRIDLGYNTNRSGWFYGDSDYSGFIDFDDFVRIDLAFNSQNGTLIDALNWLEGEDRSGSAGPGVEMVIRHYEQFGLEYANAFYAAVPEPGSMGLLVMASIGTLRRRRRE